VRARGRGSALRRTAGGRVGAATGDGRTKVAKSQTRQPRARTRTVARGGFGRRATSAGG